MVIISTFNHITLHYSTQSCKRRICSHSFLMYMYFIVIHYNLGILSTIPLSFGQIDMQIYLLFCASISKKKYYNDFGVGLLMRVCYPKRSSNPHSYFLSDITNGACLLVGSSILIILPTWCVSVLGTHISPSSSIYMYFTHLVCVSPGYPHFSK